MKSKYDDTLFKTYDRSQIEKQYGGDLKPIEQFWPPLAAIYTNKKQGNYVDDIILKKNDHLYFFKMSDQQIFQSVKGSKNMNYSMIP